MAFIKSEGSIRALENGISNRWAWNSFQMNTEIPSHLHAQTYGWIYQKQHNIRKVVSFLARNVAQLNLHLYKRVGETDRKRLPDHPLAMLLARPNPWTTKYRLIESLVADKCIYDMAIWLKGKGDDGLPTLTRLPPARIELRGGTLTYPDQFVFHGDAKEVGYEPDQVVYFHGYNPDNNVDGSSPIASLRGLLVDEFESGRYREQLWKNGARFNGYIERPLDAPEWDDGGLTRFKDQWDNQYAGRGDHVGGTPVLEDGMRFVPAAITPEQAQYIENRKLSREECAAAYHIPPTMVGIMDNGTYGNITEQHKMLYQDTLGPTLEELQQEMGLQILPEFVDRPHKFYIEFDIQDKIEGTLTEQIESLVGACGGPFMVRSEARAIVNLPHKEEFDEPITPMNVTEGGQSSPNDGGQPLGAPDQTDPQTGPDPAPKVSDTLAKFFDRQRRVLDSKAGAGSFAFDDERWNRELAKELVSMGVDPEVAKVEAVRINATTKSQLNRASKGE